MPKLVQYVPPTAKLGTFDLSGYETIHLTEPCPMSAGAIYWARLDKMYYGNNKTERVAFARKRIGDALDAVGGIGSPGGSAVWYVTAGSGRASRRGRGSRVERTAAVAARSARHSGRRAGHAGYALRIFASDPGQTP